MAGGLSEAEEKTLLERIVGKSPEAELWVRFTTTVPTKSTAGTAASFTGYKPVKTTHTSWKTAEGGSPSKIVNEVVLSLAECTGGESELKGFEIWTSEAGVTATERKAWGELKVFKVVRSGDTASFAVGTLEVTLS